MTRLAQALAEIATALHQIDARYALVGGLAISVRAEPRTTRDVDLVLAVETDEEAETLVNKLRSMGYSVGEFLEESTTGRLSTVRITSKTEGDFGVVIDLIFFSSGLEQDIVARAQVLEVFPGVELPVASPQDLLATKVLAGRPQDIADIHSLLAYTSNQEREAASQLLERIESLGLQRGVDLSKIWRHVLAEFEP